MNEQDVIAVSAAEYLSALCKLGAPRRLIVAVSGGPDSMALLRLAAREAETGGRRILAVTVDHGLRAASRAEAEEVGRWCGAVRIEHRILAWTGDKPAAGLQAAARSARYRLLAELAAAENFEAILTGHTADDQAETVFMRLARGAGPAGLAGMPAAGLIAAGPGEASALLRPLLEFSRARIFATLGAFGQDFIADPSNDDPGFERVRTRAVLAALAEQDILTGEALCRTAARMQGAAARLEAIENEFFAAAGGVFSAHGWASLTAGDAPPPRLIARLIRAVAGGDYQPPEETAETACASALEGKAASLGGAILKKSGKRIFVFREPAALLGRTGVAAMAPARLDAGARILWDGRFIVSNRGEAPVDIVPLGREGLAEEEGEGSGESTPPEALQSIPAIPGAAGGPNRPVSGAPGVLARAIAEERFLTRLVRFP